jgi:hypothetical protein
MLNILSEIFLNLFLNSEDPDLDADGPDPDLGGHSLRIRRIRIHNTVSK